MSYLDGLMIGNGSLAKDGLAKARLMISRPSAHAAYNGWLMSVLPQYTWQEGSRRGSTVDFDGVHIDTAPQHRIVTRSCKALADEFQRWYGTGRRAIPADFVWAPTSLAVAFMDVGSLSAFRTRAGGVSALAQLYLRNFTHPEALKLAEGLRVNFGLKCSVQGNRGTPVIALSGLRQATLLIEIVKPTIVEVPVMHYKIALEEKLAAKAQS